MADMQCAMNSLAADIAVIGRFLPEREFRQLSAQSIA